MTSRRCQHVRVAQAVLACRRPPVAGVGDEPAEQPDRDLIVADRRMRPRPVTGPQHAGEVLDIRRPPRPRILVGERREPTDHRQPRADRVLAEQTSALLRLPAVEHPIEHGPRRIQMRDPINQHQPRRPRRLHQPNHTRFHLQTDAIPPNLEHFWWGRCSCSACRRWCCCFSSARGCCPSSAIRTPAGSTWPASPCRWGRSCRSSMASRSWPGAAGSRCLWRRSWSGWWSAGGSCAASTRWPTPARTRCWTCACSPIAPSARPSAVCWPTPRWPAGPWCSSPSTSSSSRASRRCGQAWPWSPACSRPSAASNSPLFSRAESVRPSCSPAAWSSRWPGLLLLTQSDATSGPLILMAGFTLASFGGGPLVALGTNLVVGSAPPEHAGSAAGVAQTANEFGYALGIATLGSIGVAVYHARMADAIAASVPSAAAAVARDTLAGATAAAHSLPDQLAAALLAVARDGFTGGLHTVAAVSAVLLAGIALVIVTTLRHLPLSAKPTKSIPTNVRRYTRPPWPDASTLTLTSPQATASQPVPHQSRNAQRGDPYAQADRVDLHDPGRCHEPGRRHGAEVALPVLQRRAGQVRVRSALRRRRAAAGTPDL